MSGPGRDDSDRAPAFEQTGAPRSLRLSVPAAKAGTRLDVWLAESAEVPSRAAAQRLIEGGHVLLDGACPTRHHVLKGGESAQVTIPTPQPSEIIAEPMPLDIRYEDEHLIVLCKPAGVVVHPAHGHTRGTLVNALLAHERDRARAGASGGGLSGIGGVERPGIVHRLDRDTSGLMLVAKDDHTHQALARQLASRTIVREYLVLVHGAPVTDEGVIDAPIGRSPRDRKKMAVVAGGRHAETRFTLVARCGDLTLMRCRLATGRTHQIRVHLAYMRLPVVGDPVYGRAGDRKRYGLDRQFLHAARLTFVHPATLEEMTFSDALPQDLSEVLDRSCDCDAIAGLL